MSDRRDTPEQAEFRQYCRRWIEEHRPAPPTFRLPLNPIEVSSEEQRRYLANDEVFLANYADGLSDLNLPDYLDHFERQGRIASFLCVRPSQTFHVVSADEAGQVHSIQHVGQTGLWISGGFFAFKREIFDYIGDGEELVEQPFQRLIAGGQLIAYRYQGFWQCMDTFKDKQQLDEVQARGNPPWEVWTRRVDGSEAAGPDPRGRGR